MSAVRVASFGSCLSNMLVNRMISRFEGVRKFHIARNRSDQFCNNYIRKSVPQLPLSHINLLKPISIDSSNPNFVEHELIINNQYSDLAPDSVTYKQIESGDFDIVVIDNYVDMGIKLSKPIGLHDEFSNSTVLLRANDYINYHDHFELGELISNQDSCNYLAEIVEFLKTKNKDAIIYVINYPYNTYKNNKNRIERAKQFESMFNVQNCIFVPAPQISKKFQLKNDPAHFEDSIYVALGGYIYNHYRSTLRLAYNKKIIQFKSEAILFKDNTQYCNVGPFIFDQDAKWTALIEMFELENNEAFNFFFGQRGTPYLSIVRRGKYIEFRAKDGCYIRGVRFLKNDINKIGVVYNSGSFSFYNSGDIVEDIIYSTSAYFNAVGSGYNGTQHEQPTYISKAAIFNRCLSFNEIEEYFQNIENPKNLLIKAN
ncbi:hypothetical protein [Aeromonas veronii]|uniref:hypothetical protein n=1 Tax=Aeromonas veronii TaxID=654 RepID=UPI003D1939D5